jgi:hypothetical protein
MNDVVVPEEEFTATIETMDMLPNVAYIGVYEAELGEIGIEFNYTPGTLSPIVEQTALGLYQFLSTEEGRRMVFDAGANFKQPEVSNDGKNSNT